MKIVWWSVGKGMLQSIDMRGKLLDGLFCRRELSQDVSGSDLSLDMKRILQM